MSTYCVVTRGLIFAYVVAEGYASGCGNAPTMQSTVECDRGAHQKVFAHCNRHAKMLAKVVRWRRCGACLRADVVSRLRITTTEPIVAIGSAPTLGPVTA